MKEFRVQGGTKIEVSNSLGGSYRRAGCGTELVSAEENSRQRGRMELFGFRAKAGGEALSGTNVVIGAIISFLSPPTTHATGLGGCQI